MSCTASLSAPFVLSLLLVVTALAAPLTRTARAHAPSTASQPRVFPPQRHVCEGGSAKNSFLPRHAPIVCTHNASTRTLQCTAGVFSPLVLIRDANVDCTDSQQRCTLHYYMDYTPLALFALTCVLITLVTLLLALPMYFAVQKFVQCMHQVERQRLLRKARLVKHVSALYLDDMKREGYGSFGGRLHTLGKHSDSLASILDYDPSSQCDASGARYRQVDNSVPLDAVFVEPPSARTPA